MATEKAGILLDEISANDVTTPDLGDVKIFFDSMSGKLAVKKSDGTVFYLTAQPDTPGEANTTSNTGTGAGLALAKNGVDLPFKSLKGTTNKIGLTVNANDVTFDVGSNVILEGDARLSDARTPLAHLHAISDVTGLQTALDGKAALSHTHAESDVTGLVADLAGKQASLGYTAENTANKGAASGYADLDSNSKLTKNLASKTQVPTLDKSQISSTGTWANGEIAQLPTLGTAPSPARPINIVNSEIASNAAILKSKLASLAIDDNDVNSISQSKISSLVTDLSNKADLSAGKVLIGELPTGSSSSTVCIGNDSRLSDSRTPTAHHTTHESGGTDVVTLAESQITNLTTDLSAKYSATNRQINIVNTEIDAAAAIAKTKLASLAIVDADVSAISESKITNLVSDLAGKQPTGAYLTSPINESDVTSLTTDLATKEPLLPSKTGNARKILYVSSDETSYEWKYQDNTLETLLKLEDNYKVRDYLSIIGVSSL